MLLASFFDSAFSRQFALKLRASSESLGIKCRVFDRSGKPALQARSGWKAEALLSILLAYPGDDVLLADAESVLNRRPDVLLDEKDYEIAFHCDVETLVASGPLFVRNCERARRMVVAWHEMNLAHPENADLDNLSRMLSRPSRRLEVRNLPLTYAWVERLHRPQFPSARPVLTHFWTDGLITTRIKVAL